VVVVLMMLMMLLDHLESEYNEVCFSARQIRTAAVLLRSDVRHGSLSTREVLKWALSGVTE